MTQDFEFLKKQINTMTRLTAVLKEMRKIVDYNMKDEEEHYVEWLQENYGGPDDDSEIVPEDILTEELEEGHIYSSLRIVEDFLNDMR
jgi:uncharacterized NAD(P)/FAD-binding protein YdhS